MRYIMILMLLVSLACNDDGESYVDLPAMGNPLVTVFDGKIFVICGYHVDEGQVYDYGGVYSSENGEDWILVKDKPPFTPRAFASSVVYNGKLWIIGGQDTSSATPSMTPLSDVWSTTNGEDWELVTEDAIGGIHSHASVVHNGKMWIIGGATHLYGIPSNLACSSVDGKDWDCFNMNMSVGGDMVVKDSKLYTCSGSKMYMSTNAATWEVIVDDTLVPARGFHSFLYFQDMFWVFGGRSSYGNPPPRFYDSWSAFPDDLNNWFRESVEGLKGTDRGTFNTNLPGRGIVLFRDRLWDINGGYWNQGYTSYNWCSEDGVNWTRI